MSPEQPTRAVDVFEPGTLVRARRALTFFPAGFSVAAGARGTVVRVGEYLEASSVVHWHDADRSGTCRNEALELVPQS